MRFGVFGTVLFALLAAGSVAEARELTYAAPAGCPTRETVAARLDPTGRPAVMTIDRIGDAYAGVVTLGDGATATSRSVRAQSCKAVVDALALVVALDAEPPAAATMDGAPPATVAPAPAPTTSAPELTSAGTATRDATEPAPKAPSRALDLYTGLLATGTGYPTNGTLVGASLFFEAGLAGPSWWQPSARALLSRTLSQHGGLDTTYSFQLTTAALEPCPLALGSETGALRLSACGRGELGAVEVTPLAGQGATRMWAAAGGAVRGRVALATVDKARVALDLGVGLLAPLVHDRFLATAPPTLNVFQSPYSVVASTSTSVWEASLGLGVILP